MTAEQHFTNDWQ